MGPDLRRNSLGPKGENSDNLHSCYTNCLQKMKEENLRSIAFPCISAGIYGYPIEAACKVAMAAVSKFMQKQEDDVDLVIFCVKEDKDFKIYEKLLSSYFE